MAELVYIDVSTWQKVIDYKTIAKHIDGVILRCGYTGYGSAKSKQKDSMFETHYKGFLDAGVPIGVYWYSCASSVSEAKEEARLTLEYIKGKKIELPVFWDTEDTHHQKPLSKQKLSEVAKAYCKAIESAGYYVGIYGSTSWLNNELDMNYLKNYDVWVAHYGVAKPTYKGTYGIWQHTSGGSLPGYTGRLDMNKAYKDYKTLIKNAGLNNLSEPSDSKPSEDDSELKKFQEENKQLKERNTYLEDIKKTLQSELEDLLNVIKG